MPNKKRYAQIKAEKKADATWVKENMQRHETDMVSLVFRLRERMRNLQDVVNTDLRKMTGNNAVFVLWSADEMTAIATVQRMVSAMFAAHCQHDLGFEKRVLKRVAAWEELAAREAAKEATKEAASND